MTNWVTAAIVLVAMVWLNHFPNTLYWVPYCALSGVIWIDCYKMLPLQKIKEIVDIDTNDILIAVVTLVCTLWFGTKEGMGLSFAFSILLFFQERNKPYFYELGRIPLSSFYANVLDFPNATVTNGVLVFRFAGNLCFQNAHFLKTSVHSAILRYREKQQSPLYYFILDCSEIPCIDTSGVFALRVVYHYLRDNHISLILTDVNSTIIKSIQRSHHLSPLIRNHCIFYNVFFAHMYIFARLKFSQGDRSFIRSHLDYIDEQGLNRIQFNGINWGTLNRPLNDEEEAILKNWEHFDLSEPVVNSSKKEIEPEMKNSGFEYYCMGLGAKRDNKKTFFVGFV
ncbi:hypothetical protein RFI_27886 [Reticulomyxa filosa]|uniref:STAS domain-containing protein n=1 Tax=Reticulomyxa filosa TaxID=46433 RepID=X6M6G0_RETFI|nr:hypothetical protein RFI_27886 [Reticulomyxa filosa]|eukprot:ETO09489.1 hypothetical protein RFI_27886 [Reticulomyxa filosa]